MSKSKGRKLAEWLRGLETDNSGNVKAGKSTFKSGSIGTSQLEDDAVTTAKIDDLGVTFGKLHTALVITESGGIGNNDNDSTIATSAAIVDYVSANTGIGLTDLSVGTPNSASGSGAISYSNSTGVFKYTPPDLSSYLTSVPAQTFASLTGKPTTISGYGITDAFNGAYSSLTGTPTIPTSQELSTTGLNNTDDLGSSSSAPLSAGWYAWGSSQPSNSPNDYALMYQLNDGGQPQQWVMAYGDAANSVDLYARRRTGGSWDTTWTKFWNSTDFSSTNVTNWNTAYSSIYTNSSVDSHLNTSTATSNQVLAWTGSDYDWVAQSGGWSGGTLSANILLNTTGSATSSTSYPSYSLILRGQGWDTNGSYASNVDWYIRNETIASVYPDSDLVFYEQDPAQGHYKVKFHGRGSGANYLAQAAASFYGDVSINQTVDSTGGTLTVSNIPEIGADWNPVVLEDSGVIKKDSAVLVHGSGYLKAAYLNMTHGASGATSDTVFYSSGDDYIRKNSAGGFVASLLNATSNPSLTTTHDVHFRNYVYNSTGGTPTRGGFGYHVYQCWSQNCSVNITDSSWVRGDIIDFINVRGNINITVTGSRIYMPSGSHDTVVTWNATKGGFRLIKYSSSTGYWMVGNLL